MENGTPIDPGQLGALVRRFLDDNPGQVTDQWLTDLEHRLERAVEFFGTNRPLTSIQPNDLREWLHKKLSHLAGSTQRHYFMPYQASTATPRSWGTCP